MINDKYYCACKEQRIGIIDSGVGGITVLSAILNRLPSERYIYLADKSGAPYGDKSSEYILSRTVDNCTFLMEQKVKAIVVACNTATNVGIAHLRKSESFLSDCVYVGVEPAVKPAVLGSQSGKILVLLTPATAAQQKFCELINRFDTDRIIISPQRELASLIEYNIDDIERLSPYVFDILSGYSDVGAVVLGCTHYVYLKNIINRFYRGKAKVYDGNEGVAARLYDLLDERKLLNCTKLWGGVEFVVI